VTSEPDQNRYGLRYPQSVAIFETYDQASLAVGHLANHHFPVENLMIVGTDLKTVERVLSRKTWSTVLSRGVFQGLGTAIILFLLMWLFLPSGGSLLRMLGTAVGISVGVSVGFGALNYATSRGKRDFNSTRQTVATRYEILCEHTVAQQARDLLDQTIT